jgi:hypothetical protein
MNIVYLLTNKTKTEGRRFYIGSKQECYLVSVDGVDTIISCKTGKPYYSSSSSFEMRADMESGHVFEASVLEEVVDRKQLLEAENNHIVKFNAVKSDEYYNIGNAVLNCHDQDAVANRFGQTVKELARDNSSCSKRDNNAEQLGFSNFGLLAFHIQDMRDANSKLSWASIAREFGKDKHWAIVFLKPYNMVKARLDLAKTEKTPELRKLIAENCSLFFAAKLLDIEIPAARVMLGDFNKLKERAYSVALLNGMSREEMEVEVTKMIIEGSDFGGISKKLGITLTSVKRYFIRCVRRRLRVSDL